MYIAAADAGVVYGDEDIVGGLNCWVGLLFECDVVGFVEDEGEVLFAHSISYVRCVGGAFMYLRFGFSFPS